MSANKSAPHIRYGIYPYNCTTEEYALYLPIPSGIQTSDDGDWEAEDNWGMVAASGLGSMLDISQTAYEAGSDGKKGLAGKAKGAWGSGVELTKAITQIGANAIANMSPTAKTLARGKTLNMSKEHFYKGKAFRTFTFGHNLNANNQQESNDIREVIKILRLASSPGVDDYWFQWPSDIWPRFYSGETESESRRGTQMVENPWLPKIERCIIKGIEVNYATQEPYHQHTDGSPTMVEVQIELEEIIQKTRDVINTPMGTIHHRPSLEEKFAEARSGARSTTITRN